MEWCLRTLSAYEKEAPTSTEADKQVLRIAYSVLRRCLGWPCPANWCLEQWGEELRGAALEAAERARNDFDPGFGVPLDCFIYLRMFRAVLQRYRDEWGLNSHLTFVDNARIAGMENLLQAAAETCGSSAGTLGEDGLRNLEAALPELRPEDRLLMDRLFWRKWPQERIGRKLRLSQRAVSKRKHKVLSRLRDSLAYSAA